MITEERMAAYINSLYPGNTELLDRVEKAALQSGVPIVRKETQSLLRFLVTAYRPLKILEIGTAVGFSALLMSEYAPDGCHITTIEKYQKRIPIARENFSLAGKADDIILLEGDAAEILRRLEETYDFVFVDAAKGQYPGYLPEILRLLRPGGILVSDNVLQDGDIIESRFAVERRNRTIHARMREYLYTLTHCKELTTAVLTTGDGVTVSVKNQNRPE